MNFPNATADDWTNARRRLERFARRHDLTADQAEEIAQAALCDLLTCNYRGRCPATLAVAVGWRIRTARRYGVWTLAPGNSTRRDRSGMEPSPVRDVAPSSTNPATMAEAGEALAERMPRYAARARAEGLTPAGLALIAAGWGPLDDDDAARTTPAVPQCGPGYTPPARGCRGLWKRRRPATPGPVLDGVNLEAYRAALAVYYAR